MWRWLSEKKPEGGSRDESYAANFSDVVGRRAARQSKVETDTFPIKKDRSKNIHFSSKYRSRKSATLDFPLWFTIGNSPKFPGNSPKIDGSPTSKSDFSKLRKYFYLGPFSMSQARSLLSFKPSLMSLRRLSKKRRNFTFVISANYVNKPPPCPKFGS